MIRGYVAFVDGDSPSADILPDSASCKKTAVALTATYTPMKWFEFYISIKGTDYSFKVIGNVRTVDKRNIASGLLRIGFIVPNLDIVVSGNPEELEVFVYTLVAVKDLIVLPPLCNDCTHKSFGYCNYSRFRCPVPSFFKGLCNECWIRVYQNYNRDDARNILNTRKLRIRITDPMLTRYKKGLRHAMKGKWLTAPFDTKCFCNFGLDTVVTDPMMRLSSITVNSYPYLRRIDASSSDLVEIPETLGSLPCLTVLNLADNRLGQATNWNWLTSPFLRENLYDLSLDGNELSSIPKPILGLKNLRSLKLTRNCLTELPTALGSLKLLSELYIARNKLVILPGWMYRKQRFSMLHVSRNEFPPCKDKFKTVAKQQLQRNVSETVTVPSLFKTVARYIITNSLAFWEYNIPTMLTKYLEAAYICRCDSVVFPDTTGPVVQRWINVEALAESDDSYRYVGQSSRLPIAIRCCSYECYNLI